MLGPLTSAHARALLSPSARVLVASADLDGGVCRAAGLPWSDVHWPTLISLTAFERAEPQVFRLLRAAPVGAVPEDVMQVMQGMYRVAVFRGDELADAAGMAADALTAARLPVLWLKGAALAMQHRDGFSVRSMGDLDVLVSSGDLAAARAVLRTAGWRDGVDEESYLGHHHDAPMFWRGGIRLELHTDLFPPGNPFTAASGADWLAKGVSVRWNERTVQVLPSAWHVVHASVHWAWNHEGAVGTWQYLHDLPRLTAGWTVASGEWQAVAAQARWLSATVPVGWALWTSSCLGDADKLDSTLIAALRGRRGWLNGLAEREWVLRAFHSPAASPSVRWSRYWWRHAMSGLGDSQREWPWMAGRSGIPVAVSAPASPRRGSARDAVTKWRRHLSRVLGG